MKKLFSLFLLAGIVTACGNDNTTNEAETTGAPVTPGIDNVNGNIPDTGEAVRLNQPLPVDSVTGTAADTAAQR